MNNTALLRTLITYAICVPLAIALGYIVTMAAYAPTYSDFGVFGVMALILIMPILLRWHHIFLVFSWNFGMTLFFLPARPSTWLLMVGVSLGISLLQRALNAEKHFISAPQVTWPLICLTMVVVLTAKFTGGFGLKSMGSDVWGGRKYVYLFAGILGYFALTARRIPPERAGFYVALFFLVSFANVIGDTVRIMPSAFNFVFLFFPPNGYAFMEGSMRLGGIGVAATGCFSYMLARYGVRGIFLSGRFWRPIFFVVLFCLVFLGGFRSFVISCALIFTFQFFLQGMHRTKLLPLFIFIGIAAAVAVIPLANKLPYTFQRSLAFLPLNIDPGIRMQAEGSSNWRWEMARALAPQIPQYLLLGKGYALSAFDLESADSGVFHPISAGDLSSAVAGDFHNGPMSVILPFGIWGVIAFLWFQIASLRALYANLRYGDAALQNVNTLLFAAFLTHVLIFWSPIFGDLASDMGMFTGLIALSVSLNGGVCKRPVHVPQPDKIAPPAFRRPRFQPAFPR